MSFIFFFFNDTATTEIYTLSLHDALPIYLTHTISSSLLNEVAFNYNGNRINILPKSSFGAPLAAPSGDRKSTRLNSSHSQISYAVFCLKKKKKNCSLSHFPAHGMMLLLSD